MVTNCSRYQGVNEDVLDEHILVLSECDGLVDYKPMD